MSNLLDPNFETMTFSDQNAKCLFCDEEFQLSFKLNQNTQKIDQLRKHLIVQHQFIISDINEIDDLNGYLHYWRNRMAKITDLKAICALIKTNTKPEDTGECVDYYMLCPDILPEDQVLRKELKIAKLNYMMKIQEQERNETNFERSCLFCRKTMTGNRSVLFDHLNEVHSLKLGNPNNIVFVREFFDLIEKKLNNKICLYCERYFKDWQVLKEHMRKKMHKHLNPHNKEYDEFYLINYSKKDTKWYKSKKANDTDDEETEDTYDDWIEIGSESIRCLFCPDQHSTLEDFKQHLLKLHLFDFNNLDQYSFYKKIQILNYIRTRTKEFKCINCDLQFENSNSLSQHLVTDNHNRLPLKELWNSDQYYQPAIENDALLRLIDVDDSNDLDAEVIPE